MMRGCMVIISCLLVAVCACGETYYLDMKQAVTNPVLPPVFVRIEVGSQAEAISNMTNYAADPDYFGDSGEGELAYTALYHVHHHGEPAQACTSTIIGEHASNHKGLSQYIEIATTDAEPNHLEITYVVACKNYGQQVALENKIKAKHAGRKWKTEAHYK